MYKLCASLLALLLLLACRSQPPATELKAYDLADSTPQETPAKVYGSFNATTLYALLAAEIAGQRQLPSLALETYLEQARATLDPGIAERALQIAEYLRDSPSAQEAALIWAKAAPQERAAQRSAAIHLALAGRHIEASEYMERALDNNSERFDFLELGHLGDDPQGRADLLQSLDILLKKYPENTQVILSKAQLLSQSGETEQALQLLSEQHSKKNSHTAVLLHSHLLQTLSRRSEALDLLSQALKQSPSDLRLRFARAKLLLEENRLPEAHDDLIHLLAQSPEDDSLRYMLAQIYLEQQAWQEAIAYLEELIERENYLDAAHFSLGRAFAAQGDSERALTEYAQVADSDYYLSAQFQSTDILLAQGRAEEAQQRLAGLRENLSEYRPQLYQMEIELLTKHGQYPGAQIIAKQALEEFPGTPELLYARAMLAEKQNDLAQLERDLWSIIERDPSSSMALNALGYTLVDRTDRLDEGKSLIKQALALSPNDPAILDSLGWAHYRLGELNEAEPLLRKALAEFPDAEVAAHLGEVLWQLGKRREARKIWREALGKDQTHSILQNTILRLTGKAKP
ncbi:hypothetical protein AXE65_02480 [Ventosimonas gracilis]|uniref:Tetratricopeptide repeat protein n=1 Tax=Ventosimonas gracilis TaxID=1680762 RepID=A0A139SUQ8_9GAMM|nr:tetratricopeptide repeat protein [Ventosimonas gracilis]KXU38170.1 hypothetical protein AXE65_02480 [Ventosimonas gracilis]